VANPWAFLPPHIGKCDFRWTIEKGAFGIVKEAVGRESGARRAVKIIPKGNMKAAVGIERFARGVRAELKMDHPGIVRMHNFVMDTVYLYLIMELCGGDTLESQLPPLRPVNGDKARPIFKQILDTLKYTHELQIVHRGPKLDSVLIDQFVRRKLTDFGFSRFTDPGHMFATPCGSPTYAAPEVMDRQPYDWRGRTCGAAVSPFSASSLGISLGSAARRQRFSNRSRR